MKKSVLKRIKLNKNGQFLRLPMGRGHNNTRKSANLLRQKRKLIFLTGVNIKLLKNYLHTK